MTLFVVAIVLLVVVIRDQRSAIKAVVTELPASGAAPGPGDSAASAAEAAAGGPPTGASGPEIPGSAPGTGAAAGTDGQPAAGAAALAQHVASVERGRIAALGGIVNLIWLAILVLMVWQP
jgi:hypothetical protein